MVVHVPSSTPVTMEAKLSSVRIMSAASLDTSEPVIPIAIPAHTDREIKTFTSCLYYAAVGFVQVYASAIQPKKGGTKRIVSANAS